MDSTRTDTEAGKGGQALIEMIVGLVAMLAIFAGLLQVTTLTRAHADTQVAARQEAGNNALNMLYRDGHARFIRDWNEAADRKRYTRDDEAEDGDTGRFRGVIVDRAAGDMGDWNALDRIPLNAVSRMRAGQEPIEAFGLVRGYDSREVSLLPAVQSLIYRAKSIDVESEVWLTWSTGIY